MAERGIETLVFGPMKPVGLTNPHNPEQKPYAVVQLRQDNKEDTLRNMVGFQTKLKYGEQQRIFRMIPGLENAEFARLGGIHRNTFIKAQSCWMIFCGSKAGRIYGLRDRLPAAKAILRARQSACWPDISPPARLDRFSQCCRRKRQLLARC